MTIVSGPEFIIPRIHIETSPFAFVIARRGW